MGREYLNTTQRTARILGLGVAKFGSKAAFARALKMHPSNLMRKVEAANPHLATLRKYAKVLEVEVEVFIYR